MDGFIHQIVAFIASHPHLAILVVGGTAFGESFVFLSLLFPGTTILIATGALVKVHAVDPVSAAFAGILGAILGDAVSFWIGRWFGPAIPGMWPFRKHPEVLETGIDFFRCYGWASVFIGRFFGPLRAVIPLAAGTLRMPTGPFYVANVLSAAVWAPTLLFSGYLISTAASGNEAIEDKLFYVALAAVGVVACGIALRRLFRVR